jgi:tonB family C-terminal domain|nr:energy transducer TonB [uncultured Capnocytophaga sp.]
MKAKTFVFLLCFAVIVNSYAQQDNDEETNYSVLCSIYEQRPIFVDCKDLGWDEQFQCFEEQIEKHIKTHFCYPKKALEKGIQGRVVVDFTIKINGTIKILKITGTDEELKAAARSVIESLPRLIPGKKRGKPIAVKFSCPINFKLTND